MATERATGIAGNQGSRRTSATESREASKGRLKKIAPWFAGILVVLAVLTWWRNLPEDKDKDTNSTATSPSQQYPQAPAMVVHPGKATEDGQQAEVRVGVIYREVTSKEEPLVLMGREGFCIRYWGKNPDGTAFVAWVRGVNKKEWLTHDEFRTLEKAKKAPYKDIGWFKFIPNEDSAEVFYEYRMKGQCN